MSDIPPLDDIFVLIEKYAEAGGSSSVAIAAQVLSQLLSEATDRVVALDDANHQLASVSLYLEKMDDVDRDESLLSDIIGRADMLELACGRCERGRLSVARLAQESAPKTPLSTIMRAQIGDCPRRNEREDRDRCDPHSPTLWPLFSGSQ